MTELNERGRTAPFNFPIEDKSEKIIKVIGDGGGGNAVQHMWDERVKDVSFFVSVSKASGEKRLLKAMTEAISSPLIANVEKLKTRWLLYIVYSAKKGPAKMDELDELCEFMEYFDEDILLGHYMDDSLEDEIKVSVVATGFDQTVSVAGKGSDVSDEQRQLQLLREQYYGKAKRPLKHREETLTGAAESESDDIVAEDVEKEAISSNRPNKKRSFMRGLVEKMKVLMEEEC